MTRATEELNYRDEKDNKRGAQDGEGKKEKNDLMSHPVEACINSSVLQATGLRTCRAHLPQIDQCRLILPIVHLQSDAIRAIDNGPYGRLDDAAGAEAHRDAVADFELTIWLLLAGHD